MVHGFIFFLLSYYMERLFIIYLYKKSSNVGTRLVSDLSYVIIICIPILISINLFNFQLNYTDTLSSIRDIKSGVGVGVLLFFIVLCMILFLSYF
jgi:hypothetical protein